LEKSTRNTFRYRQSLNPADIVAVAIRPDAFKGAKKSSRKKSKTDCLIIGFDTEYQSISAIGSTKASAEGAQNELLSYQFCVRHVSKGSDEFHETVGIIIPDPSERWPIRDLIGAAIGKFLQEYPDQQIAENVYLIGHFTRADVPMFDGFVEDSRTFYSNVRNTFVSIDNYMPMDVVTKDGSEVGTFQVKLRDTILLAPANAKSLNDIGEIVGLPKIKLADDPRAERKIKENMKQFRQTSWPEFKRYALRDAEVCVAYAFKVLKQWEKLFDDFSIPVTLTSFGTQLLIKSWEESELSSEEILGVEHTTHTVYNMRTERYQTKREVIPIEQLYFHESFITETYHGGRNEQFIFGIADESYWRDFDLSSAYPSVMAMIGKPDWERLEANYPIESFQLDDLAFASVEFEFPENVRYPTLPVRTESGIIFPRKGRSNCAAPEIVIARELGAKLIANHTIYVPQDRDREVFGTFIADCIGRRKDFGKGTFENLFWKEVGNSTYGKTAQGLRKKRVYDLRADDMAELPRSRLTQPFFASFITSYTRALLGEIMNGLPENVQVFSVTTDGFLSNASDEDIIAIANKPLIRRFAAVRDKLLGQISEPLEVKHEIRQPLGWRTRGSATLKSGEAGDIVIQKGGIKSGVDQTPEEENERVVRLFFDRRPDQVQKYTTGISLKDIIAFKADFVSREVEKRLSMEFDFKRKPIRPEDRTVEFGGSNYTHLSFQTEPWETVEEFQAIRQDWASWFKRKPQSMKTVADYTRFEHFRETGKASGDLTYIATKDGDIKRLRKQLSQAFRQNQAGFDVIKAKSPTKITQKEFALALQECGIPCLVRDVDNARTSFQPNQTPDTEAVRQALQRLKEIYHDLDTGLFIASHLP
jgi:hypothetical protein